MLRVVRFYERRQSFPAGIGAWSWKHVQSHAKTKRWLGTGYSHPVDPVFHHSGYHGGGGIVYLV